MVQRKANLHILDTQLVNLKPSSPPPPSSSMKKSRSIKESRSTPPFKTKKTPQKQFQTLANASPPNYMKSTSSFEARKEASPKNPGSKTNESSSSSSGIRFRGSRTTSLKVRTLTKTPSFKPLRSSKKVIICEDVDSQRATCSSRLKDSKFPDYLQLNDELEGTSAMKVCPYTYCSLNGHHHASVPPLKCFLSARRRALKTQNGFKLGCLSKPASAVKEPVIVTPEEDTDFFIDILTNKLPACQKTNPTVDTDYADDKEQPLAEKNACIRLQLVEAHACKSPVHQVYNDLEYSDIFWEEGYHSDSDKFKLDKIDGVVAEDQMEKASIKRLHQELYDEERVSSGAWSKEYGDSASESSCQHLKINQDYMDFDESELSSTTSESDINDKMDQNIDHQQEQSSQEPKTVPDSAEKLNNEFDKNHTTIIYNTIQFNISVFINGQKTEHYVQVHATSVAADKLETEEAIEEQNMCNDNDKSIEVNQVVADEELPLDVQDIALTELSNEIEKHDNSEQECNEEPAVRSDEITSETDIKTDCLDKKTASDDMLSDPCKDPMDLTRGTKAQQEAEDGSWEFNPRGPNFLPETSDPDAETVDLRHQEIDGRKNAEEFMVDFALQQAVTILAPARKKKVALLVEAFEKVMPDPVPVRGPVQIPGYESHNRHTSKAFTNSRPMQACS